MQGSLKHTLFASIVALSAITSYQTQAGTIEPRPIPRPAPAPQPVEPIQAVPTQAECPPGVPCGLYIHAKAGLNFRQSYATHARTLYTEQINRTKFKLGHALSAAIGYEFYPFFALEFEYNYNRNNFKRRYFRVLNNFPRGSFSRGQIVAFRGYSYAHEFFLNGIYNWVNDTEFTPYMGVGFGAVDYHDKGGFRSISKTGFGGQALAGIDWRLIQPLSLTLDYQFAMMENFRGGNRFFDRKVKYRAHTIFLGLKYRF